MKWQIIYPAQCFFSFSFGIFFCALKEKTMKEQRHSVTIVNVIYRKPLNLTASAGFPRL